MAAGTAAAGRGPGADDAATGRASSSRLLVPALLFIALVVAAVGSLGAPLITSVAADLGVSLASAQWTLTATLLAGAVATPVLGRLGAGSLRRRTVLATLAVVVTGSVLTVAPLGFGWLLAGRAAQGTGLGLTALMMATARDHLSTGAGGRGPGANGGRPSSAGETSGRESRARGQLGAGGAKRARTAQRDRAASAIALISVASTAGIGVGYPLAGLLTELAGLRAAYTLGLVVTVAALGIAILATPDLPARPVRTAAHAMPPPAGTLSGAGAQSGTGAPSRDGPSRAGPPSGAGSHPPLATPAAGGRVSLDLPGAFLLAAGLIAVLLAVGDPGLWQRHLSLAGGLLGAAALLLAAWVIRERRASSPLVDISLLRHPAVARANVVMLAGGAGMYLLLTIITRYVQTPASAGYGFGVSTFVAGLALVPFSVLGFAAGRVTPRLSARIGPAAVLAVSSVIVAAAFAMFALARTDLPGHWRLWRCWAAGSAASRPPCPL